MGFLGIPLGFWGISLGSLSPTCEDVCEGVAAGDFQGGVFGPEDVEQEGAEAAQDAQEAEGGDDPQQQHRLRVHAEIWGETGNSSQKSDFLHQNSEFSH